MPPVSTTNPPAFDRIFVGGLPPGTTEAQLRAGFALVGVDVGQIEMVFDRATGWPRGFAFVDLPRRLKTAVDTVVLDQLKSATLNGNALQIRGIPLRGADASH